MEDNDTNREILHQHAVSWAMHPETAANSREAWEKLLRALGRQQPFDLVLIDMKMPGQYGLELGQQIKAEPVFADTPLVLLTSTLFTDEAADAHEAGFAAYLRKPIRKAELYRCLAQILSGSPSPPPVAADQGTRNVHRAAAAATLSGRLLLAEDNPVNQAVATAMLQGFGCSVTIAHNGREAVQAVQGGPFDLVLMDCMMPELDGYEATQEIRRQQRAGRLPTCPIVALTANAIEGDRERCLAAGMDDYLPKPFKAAQLLEVLQRWLRVPPEAADPGPEPAAEAAAAPEPVLDPAPLDAIRAMQPGAGDRLVQQVIALYLENSAKLLASLEQGLAQADLAAIRHASHTLKSSSAQVGAVTLAELCRDVEVAARDGTYDPSGTRLEQIRRAHAAASAALQQYLGPKG